MSWLGRLWADRIGRSAGATVVKVAAEAIEQGVFDDAIQGIIVDTLRQRDTGLSRVGFIMKIAVELVDRSTPPLPFVQARDIAYEVYAQFRHDNEMVKFGHPDWDWSGAGARTLAQEYEIDHWEPIP